MLGQPEAGGRQKRGLLPLESKMGLEADSEYNAPILSKSLPSEEPQPMTSPTNANVASDNPFLARLNPLISTMKDRFKNRLQSRMSGVNNAGP